MYMSTTKGENNETIENGIYAPRISVPIGL